MGQPQTLSERIRRAREDIGWTQARLAAEIGVDAKTVRNWESGRGRRPRSLRSIEKALGVNLTRPVEDLPSIDDFSDGQLLQGLANRLADRDRTIVELNEQIRQLQADPSTAEGRWAARVREP